MLIYHFVYKTTNLVNGKFYVGKHSTTNLDDGYLGSGKVIRDAIKKYGKESFKREILDLFESEEAAYEFEATVVNHKDPLSYNVSHGGVGSPFGHVQQKEHVAKITRANTGKIRSEETRKRLRDSHMGKKLPEEQKARIGLALRGHEVSLETRIAISNKKKGQLRSDEQKERIRIGIEKNKHKNRKVCPYCGREFSLSMFARWHGDKCKLNTKES